MPRPADARSRAALALAAALAAAALAACDGDAAGAGPGEGADDDADIASDIALDIDPDDAGPEPDAGAPPLDPLPAGLSGALDAALAAGFPRVGAPGLAIRVSLPGREPWRRAAGLASVTSGRPAVPGDRFRIGSLTKTFAAALVLLLVEDGVLALDDPVDAWVPGFDLGGAVTLERLLNHTSGVFDYTDDYDFLVEAQEDTPPRDVVAWAAAHGPAHAPGEAWRYTNTGYFLLALAVEAATGEPLAALLRARLLDPVGLADTFLEGDEPIPGGLAEGHLLEHAVDAPFSMTWAWASGGMVSTVDDLCRWLDALYRGDVLPAAAREAMVAPTALPGGATAAYGYGTYLETFAGLDVVGHTGSTMGFNATAFVHRPSGACVAALSNDFFGVPEEVAGPAWEAVAAWLAGGAAAGP